MGLRPRDEVQYVFGKGIRKLLISNNQIKETLNIVALVFDKLSCFLDRKTGKQINFRSIVSHSFREDHIFMIEEENRPYASIAVGVLYYLGVIYQKLAMKIEKQAHY